MEIHGISDLIISFVNINTLSQISRISKYHELAITSRNKIQDDKTKIDFIGNKIIEIYETDNIKQLNTNSIELYSKILPYIDDIFELESIWFPIWKNSNNFILLAFYQTYYSHYVLKNKSFINMSINHSFVTTTLMSLYH
jgi:hypothetical protein